jgi:transcriptional regulator with XRE-family HTH domain
MTPEDLRRWQEQMGYTYDSASKALGVARRTYADWLAGKSKIPGPVDLACAAAQENLLPYSKKQVTSHDMT